MIRVLTTHLTRRYCLLHSPLLPFLPTPRPRFFRVTTRHHDLAPQDLAPNGPSPPEEPPLAQDHSLLARLVKLEQAEASRDARLLELEAIVGVLQNSSELDEEVKEEQEGEDEEAEDTHESAVLAERMEILELLLKCETLPERERAELLYSQARLAEAGGYDKQPYDMVTFRFNMVTFRFIINVLRAQREALDGLDVDSPYRAAQEREFSHYEYIINYALGRPWQEVKSDDPILNEIPLDHPERYPYCPPDAGEGKR